MCRSQSLSTTLHDVAWLPDSVYPCLHCHVGKDLELDVVTGVHHESSAIQIIFVSAFWGCFYFSVLFLKDKVCPLQWSVFGFISGHDVLAATTVLSQLSHLLPQRRIFPLQKRSAHCDLVLLQPPGVTWTFGCHVVLLPPRPVFIVLWETEDFNTK